MPFSPLAMFTPFGFTGKLCVGRGIGDDDEVRGEGEEGPTPPNVWCRCGGAMCAGSGALSTPGVPLTGVVGLLPPPPPPLPLPPVGTLSKETRNSTHSSMFSIEMEDFASSKA